jgi:acyl-CoA thioesterase I
MLFLVSVCSPANTHIHMPNKTSLHRFIWISGFLIALILSACSSTGSQSLSSHSHTGSGSVAAQVTPMPMPDGPVTYVALGASDAVGVGSNSLGSQGYVPLIAGHLPKGSHSINLGISGIRLHEALSEELPLALTTSPDLITVWLVVNDFIGGVTYNDYMHDLSTLLQRLHTGTHARIVMADLPDLTRLPSFAHETPMQKTRMLQAIQQWNKGIAQLARQYGVVLLDLFMQGSQLTAHPEYISIDGFHPSPSGYVQLATYFWQAIRGQ